jgi:hypothetical protein
MSDLEHVIRNLKVSLSKETGPMRYSPATLTSALKTSVKTFLKTFLKTSLKASQTGRESQQ